MSSKRIKVDHWTLFVQKYLDYQYKNVKYKSSPIKSVIKIMILMGKKRLSLLYNPIKSKHSSPNNWLSPSFSPLSLSEQLGHSAHFQCHDCAGMALFLSSRPELFLAAHSQSRRRGGAFAGHVPPKRVTVPPESESENRERIQKQLQMREMYPMHSTQHISNTKITAWP